MQYLFLFGVFLTIAFAFFNYKEYKSVMNKGKELKMNYHVIVIVYSFVSIFLSELVFANVLFSIESYFTFLSYKMTVILLIVFGISIFTALLFYISAVDEMINNKVNHQKTTFLNKLRVLFNKNIVE